MPEEAPQGPSTRFKLFRIAFDLVASLMMPAAFGLALHTAPLWVRLFMLAAGALHISNLVLTLWVREKYPRPSSVKTEVKELIFHGETARQLHEFLQMAVEKSQSSPEDGSRH